MNLARTGASSPGGHRGFPQMIISNDERDFGVIKRGGGYHL